MPPRWLRLGLLGLGAVFAFLWWLPTLLVRFWLPAQIAAHGIEPTLRGVWPSGLLGVRVAEATLVHGSEQLRIRSIDAQLRPRGWRIDAALETGHVRIDSRPRAEVGLAHFRDVPLEPIARFARPWLTLPIRARGRAQGLVRWSTALELSLHIRESLFDAPILGLIRIDRIDALVTGRSVDEVQIDELIASGLAGDFAAAGTVGPDRRLELWLRIERMEPRLLDLIQALRPDLRPPPTVLVLRGTAGEPRLEQVPDPGGDSEREPGSPSASPPAAPGPSAARDDRTPEDPT